MHASLHVQEFFRFMRTAIGPDPGSRFPVQSGLLSRVGRAQYFGRARKHVPDVSTARCRALPMPASGAGSPGGTSCGAFTLDSGMVAAVRGRHVGVVDDVMTTGATLGEIPSVLKRFGARGITCLAFARTLPA